MEDFAEGCGFDGIGQAIINGSVLDALLFFGQVEGEEGDDGELGFVGTGFAKSEASDDFEGVGAG